MSRVPGLLRRLAAAALVLFLACIPAAAQTHRASMRGIVVDPDGRRLTGVAVHVLNERTRDARHVKTDHEGRYTVAEMPPGTYRLTIDQPGYGRFIARADLVMNQNYWLNIQLQAGNAIQAIDVLSPFLPSDHDTPAVHMFITDRDLNEWPNESGSYLETARLAPQTARPPQGSPSARLGRFAMNVGGAPDDANTFILDGLSNVDPYFNTPVAQPPIEAIRQFQVFTSNYDASFGRGAGAQVSVVTKSGTNAFGGSVYELIRGTFLGGRNHFAPKEGPAPDYARNQIGGTLGGPIVKNHAFFFGDYEHLHLRDAVPQLANAAAGFVPPSPRRDDSDRADVRVDDSLGEGWRLTGRYSFSDRRLFDGYTDAPARTHHAGVTFTDARSSSLVNDLRVGYNHIAQTTSPQNWPPHVAFLTLSGAIDPQGRTENVLQIADALTFSHGHHTLKAGGEWLGIHGQFSRDLLFGGRRELAASTVSGFVQNDWRPVSTLSVSAGVRYEYATPPVEADDAVMLYDPQSGTLVPAGKAGMPRGGYRADVNNIAPRAGFAWTVGADRMNVIRGGYGIYYTQPPLATSGLLLATVPFSNLLEELAGLGLVVTPPPVIGYERGLQTPRLDTWTVTLQHQLGQSRAFEFAYVGSRGRDLLAARDINEPAASPAVPNPRPNRLFSDIVMLESRAASSYNGFHIRFQQRPATGTSMFAQYTVGKATDDQSGVLPAAGDPNFPQNSRDLAAERGRAAFDIRHRFAAAITRPLPFNEGQFLGGLGFISRALSDSDLEASAVFESGRPFTVGILPGLDISNTGISRFGLGTNDRPNVNGSAALPRGTESEWFRTSAFSMPAFGTFGNSGRNTQTGPGYKSVNAAIVRHIRLGTRDRATIDLRVDAFNILGTVNYDLPDAFLGSPTFGRLLSAGSPRRVQFGVRAAF